MKIRYKRSGGFANITTSVEVDSKKLPARKAAEIRSLVKSARIFDQPLKLERRTTVADDLEHELEVEEGPRTHTIVRSDSQSPPELIRLFDRLQHEALSKKNSPQRRGVRGEEKK